jgi:peptide/nickel transport system substrate-binding protein
MLAAVQMPGLKPGENPAGQQLTGKHRGGTLTVYATADFIELDPGQATSIDFPVAYATQRPLFAYLPNTYSTLTPDMATLVPTSANGGITDGGRTVTIHIRTNVHFSPPVNRAVTSADIAYAIERAANLRNGYFQEYFGSESMSPLMGAQSPSYAGRPIPGIRTPNRATIVFHMTKPGAPLLLHALTLPLSAPVPESLAGPLNRHGPTSYGTTRLVATGPYMVKSDSSGYIAGIGDQPGKSLTLVRNPNWNASTDYRPAYLDRIDVVIGQHAPNVIGEQVLRGSDAVQLGDPTHLIANQAYRSYPSQVTFTPGQSNNWMSLNNVRGPLKNVNVRRAVWAALDRRAIVNAFGGPLFAMPLTHFIYPGVIGYALAGGAAGPRVAYNADVNGNLQVAEKYMRRAGYPSGKYAGNATIQIVGTNDADYPAVVRVVNQAFTSLGFHTHVREFSHSEMYGLCGAPKSEIDACPSAGWVRDFADPESVLYWPSYGPSDQNLNQVNDLQINSAMARAALMVDPAARAQAWADVDRMLVGQAVAAPLASRITPNIESANVAGVDALWNEGIWDFDFTSLK